MALGSPSSSRYARTASPGYPASRSDATVAPSARFESFFPSAPTTSPWWITSGGCDAERAVQRRVQLLVRPVIGAADHVRDPEVDVVDHAREVERRRPVVAPQHHAVEPLREPGGSRSLEMPLGALALPNRPVVPVDAEPAEVVEDRLLAAGTFRAGSVSSIRSSSQSPNRRFATALSALPTCSVPVGLGAKRTRIMMRR